VLFWVVEQFVDHCDRWLFSGCNVESMLSSEQKIVNSLKTILFDNRTQN